MDIKNCTSFANFVNKFVDLYNSDGKCGCSSLCRECNDIVPLLPIDDTCYQICKEHKEKFEELQNKNPKEMVRFFQRLDMQSTYRESYFNIKPISSWRDSVKKWSEIANK